MYTVTKSIDIDFAHFVCGHPGACINIHGHTWKFEVKIEAKQLDECGFVIDFGAVKRGILQPVHTLLDHSFVVPSWVLHAGHDAATGLRALGKALMSTRTEDKRTPTPVIFGEGDSLNGAWNWRGSPMKVVAFPFNPSSERLAEWLYGVAEGVVNELDGEAERGVRVAVARVYENLHPVEAFAEFSK